MAIFAPILAALEASGARYVVVGGVAVVLHGHARFTADLDLVVDLEPAAARAVVAALTGLGLRPLAPEPAERFADPEARRRWIDEKGMEVFSLHDPDDPLRCVDLFVRPPLPFEDLWRRAVRMDVGGLEVTVASLADLIRMKERVDRPQDREDVARLREIAGEAGAAGEER